MIFKNPSIRTLMICWIILIGLTIGTMMTGRVMSDTSLSGFSIVALGFITWVKSMLILRYYLNLKSASRGWNKIFNSYLFIILGIVTLIFLLGKT